MSRVCQLTGKCPSVGNNRSHALNATKRRFIPNLITKKLFDVNTGRVRKMRIAASTLRTLTKTK
ncbi:50S ribosomal protein L28 [Candidatus Peregrinibacteria bacterium CG_4_10_14_0_2_um_filter_38_24]|nr:MAG: 50S ribosomal protein L28 [Candidatus Peregrinibacteria bacterium CG_4_10_14_0_2_um_filter_38_24]